MRKPKRKAYKYSRLIIYRVNNFQVVVMHEDGYATSF